MMPFKEKTKGVIKYTTVLIILLCISEKCFGLLQGSQKIENLELFNEYQQTSPKEESRNSVSYERESLEISPYIRDVRADSRQSRIDAQDIRSDFREIRTELEGISKKKRNQQNLRRLKARDSRDRREVVSTEEIRERRNVENIKDSRENNNYSRQQLRQLSEQSVRHYRNDPRISAEQQRDHGTKRENSRHSSLYRMETRRVEENIEKSPRSRKVSNEHRNNRESSAFNRYRQPSGDSLQIRKRSYNENSRQIGQEEYSQRETKNIRHKSIRLHKMPVRDIRTEYNNPENSVGLTEKRYSSDEQRNRENIWQNKIDNLKNNFLRERQNIRVVDGLTNEERVQNKHNSHTIARREPQISRIRFEPLEHRNNIQLSRRLAERNRYTETFQNGHRYHREYDNSRDYSTLLSDRRVPREFREDNRNIARESIYRRNVHTLRRDHSIGRRAKEELSGRIQNRNNGDLYEQRQIDTARRNLETLKTKRNGERLSRNTQNTVEDRLTQPNRITFVQRRQNNRQNDQRIVRAISQDDFINLLRGRDNIRLNQELRSNSDHLQNYNRDRNTNILENNYIRDMPRIESPALSHRRHNNYRIDRNRLAASRSDWTTQLRSQVSTKNVRGDRISNTMFRRVQGQRQTRNSAQIYLRAEEPRVYRKHRLIIDNDNYQNTRQQDDRKRTSENIQYRRELRQERAFTHNYPERKSSRMIGEHRRTKNQYRRENAERRQDVRNIADERNNSASFSTENAEDSKVAIQDIGFVRKLKDNSNILINAIQTILIIALVGQVLKNTSKSKWRSINWQSFFAKEKVF